MPRCSICNKELSKWIESDGKKYCSDKCFQKSWPKCHVCGKPMKQWNEDERGRKYCSESCFRQSWPKCDCCGKPMQEWVTYPKGKKFCSDECAKKTVWPRCHVCRKPMKQWHEDEHGNKYCSEACFRQTWPKCAICSKPMKEWIADKAGIKYCSQGCFLQSCPTCEVCGKHVESWICGEDGTKYCSQRCLERKKSKNAHQKANMRDLRNSRDKSGITGAMAAGIGVGAYGQVNKAFDEERFHAMQGGGFAAERANHLYDKLTGHDAKIIGDDNIKNGADRIVDGIAIQSKYCQTGSKCIGECFDENGKFKYLIDGKPMQIEVPSDKYDAAVQAMQEKIRQGKILGITDPKEAKNIVRKGHFTYEQAKNIAKAGTVESLTYDAVNGMIIATSAFGVTATITLAVNLWNGEDWGTSLKMATYSGLKVGGTAFVTTVIAGQLSKAGLNSALVSSSEAFCTIMGPKASAILVNAFRQGGNIYGAAAMNSAAKLLRGNVITATVTVAVLSTFDVVNIFRGRISGKQLFKNLANTATTVGGGTGGWIGGAAAGTAICPGIGTIIGAVAGSLLGGYAAGKLSNMALDSFIEDDADEMVSIIQEEFETLAQDYLLSQKEAERSVEVLSKQLDGAMLKDMFASSNRSHFARNILVPIVEDEIRNRKHILAISNEQMAKSLREVLEDISDSAS